MQPAFVDSLVPHADPAQLRSALDALLCDGPLSVAFQPLVELASCEVVAYEVLGRCGRVEGPLARVAHHPGRLLEVAYAHQRLLQLDRRWRELGLAAVAAALHTLPAGVRFFLNVDPRVTEDPRFAPGHTLGLVRAHGLEPERFVLELTESGCAEPHMIERVLQHYARQGFGVALDDLGAGQQTLLAMLRVRPDLVKLDRALIQACDADPSRRHLLFALADFGRRAGVKLVAEGIETEEELRVVCEAGITLGQGFFLGRPAARPEALGAAARGALERCLSGPASSPPPPLTEDPSALLLRIAEALREEPGLEASLQLATRAAAALLGVERASVRLVDARRERLLVAARTGLPVHAGPEASFRVGEGLAGWVVARGEPLRVADAEADPRFVRVGASPARLGAFLGVPLFDGAEAVGVLAATSPHRGLFSAQHERWLRVLAALLEPGLRGARARRLERVEDAVPVGNALALSEWLLGASSEEEPLTAVLVATAPDEGTLRAVSGSLRASLRREDAVLRVGPGRLLAVLPGAKKAAAERVLHAVQAACGGEARARCAALERTSGEGNAALLGRLAAALESA